MGNMEELIGYLIGIAIVVAAIIAFIVYIVLPFVGFVLAIGALLALGITVVGALNGVFTGMIHFIEVFREAHESLNHR